nr:hypothetical protein [Spiroplasma clarkii]
MSTCLLRFRCSCCWWCWIWCIILELKDLEAQYPQFITGDSPTQRVGGIVLEKFEKYQHKTPMLSLDNAFNDGDLLNFDKQIKKR